MAGTAVWIAGLGVLFWGLHRLALLLEARGWMFYANRRPKTGSGHLFLDANALYDPGARAQLEAKRLEEAQEAERERDDLYGRQTR